VYIKPQIDNSDMPEILTFLKKKGPL